MNRRYLRKFQIKDVVFLAIMSAVALATCAVMPLVISLQPLIFGISQLVTALQIGVFFAIGLYKVRKPGSLLIMALMMGLIQLMMSPPMFDACKRSLGGKRVALFGSYGWGDGEWMRTWESDCDSAGVNLVCESVICTETPDDAALEACRALGKALVE